MPPLEELPLPEPEDPLDELPDPELPDELPPLELPELPLEPLDDPPELPPELPELPPPEPTLLPPELPPELPPLEPGAALIVCDSRRVQSAAVTPAEENFIVSYCLLCTIESPGLRPTIP